jgi:beta-phosphoglucomutase-like phosphatase (HAD superfamily)
VGVGIAVVTVVGASLEADDDALDAVDAVDAAPPDDVGVASDEGPEPHPAISTRAATRLHTPPRRCFDLV